MDDAETMIRRLGMQPHPEGGHYVETYRAPARDGERGAATCIYFLLRAGESSHWHRVDSIEFWHYQAGDPLHLDVADDAGSIERLRIGPLGEPGCIGHGVVPSQRWQAAATCGAWTLVSCTVAPAFHFEGFELAAPDWSPTGWTGW